MAAVDYKTLPLRRPQTLKFSREVGGEMARMLGDIIMPTRRADENAVLVEVGQKVGEQMYRERTTWTISEFCARVRRVTEAA